MRIHTPEEIGLLVRDRRRQLGITQAALADRLQTSRLWLLQLERGKATAQLGKVLSALTALGIELQALPPDQPKAAPRRPDPIDLDHILANATERPRR